MMTSLRLNSTAGFACKTVIFTRVICKCAAKSCCLPALFSMTSLASWAEPSPEVLSEEALDVVEVSAKSDFPDPQSQSGTYSVIDSANMEQHLVRNIKDLIRYEPGVNVGNDPQRFGATGFSIRGLGENRVLLQIDGVRLPDAFSIGSFASATRNAVDVDALKAVEIVRGSGPAQYGGDALGGTVNFVTKDPRDYLAVFGKDYYTGLKLNYNSTDNSFVQTGTVAGALNHWESMLLFTHTESNETDNNGWDNSYNGSRNLPSPQDNIGYSALAKLLYRFNEDNVLRLSGDWLDNASEVDALYARGPQFSSRFTNSLLTDDSQSRWRVSLDHTLKHLDTLLVDETFWKFYTQHSATRQTTFQDRTSNLEGRARVQRDFDFNNSDFGGELRLQKSFDLRFGTQDLQYGGQISKNSVNQMRDGSITCLDPSVSFIGAPLCPDKGSTSHTVPPFETFPVRDFPTSSVTKAGAYIQDRLTLLENRIELAPGGRWEYYRMEPQPDALFDISQKRELENAENIGIKTDSLQPAAIDAQRFLPKFGTLLHLNDAITLHGQYVHGFRGPNFAESNLGFLNPQAGYTSLPNANLQPETSVGAEIGLRGKADLGEFDLTFFRNDYKNFLYNTVVCNPGNGCPFLTYQTINSPDPIRIQGVELKSQLYLDWMSPKLLGASLQFSGNYTEGKNLSTGQINDDALRTISPMKGVLGLRYDRPNGEWGGELILTLVAPKSAKTAPENAQYLSAGYAVTDFNAYYRFGEHVTLNAGIFNLFDQTYTDWEDLNTRENDPHINLGPYADAYVRERWSRPGRNVGVTLRVAY